MIRTPIIIDARGDLLVFNSLAAAEQELSPTDIREGHYPVAYDAEGRMLRIEVRIKERRILGVWKDQREYVQIVPCEHIPTHDQALRQLLMRFIRPQGGIPEPDARRPATDGFLRAGSSPRS